MMKDKSPSSENEKLHSEENEFQNRSISIDKEGTQQII